MQFYCNKHEYPNVLNVELNNIVQLNKVAVEMEVNSVYDCIS